MQIYFERLGTHVYIHKNVYSWLEVDRTPRVVNYFTVLEINKRIARYLESRFPTVQISSEREEAFHWCFMDDSDEDAFQMHRNVVIDI